MALYLGNNKIASSGVIIKNDATPVGTIVEYPSHTVPDDWLLADGRAISRIEYSDLFSVIGTTYGNGDGTTTFNLPNFKGRVPVGYTKGDIEFNLIGKTGGETTHKLTIGEMPSHTHNLKYFDTSSSGIGQTDVLSQSAFGGYNNTYRSVGDTYPSGTSQEHNNLQPYIVVNYIIKAKNKITDISNLKDIYNMVYPIGRGFIDFTDTDYSNYLGFTWERELVGMTAVGVDTTQTEFNTIGKTGGEKNHKLILSEMPEHTHTFDSIDTTDNQTWSPPHQVFEYKYVAGTHYTKEVSVEGNSQAHNNLQPYKVVSYWKRVS